MFPGFQNLGHRLVDGEIRVVQQHRILRRLQWRNRPVLVPGVARFEVGTKTVDISRKPLTNQLLIGGTGNGLKLDQITDGTSNTLMAGEAFGHYKPRGHPRNWRDAALGINQSPYGFGGPRKSGGVIVMADASVRLLSADTDPAVLRALATPSGCEPVPDDLP